MIVNSSYKELKLNYWIVEIFRHLYIYETGKLININFYN
jgi:hypothetical protein